MAVTRGLRRLVLAGMAVGVLGCSAELTERDGSAPRQSTTSQPTTDQPTTSQPTTTAPAQQPSGDLNGPGSAALAELPRGGREVFPRFRLVGYSGSTGSSAFGRLYGDLDAVAAELEQVAQPYAAGREILPVFELITTVVTAAPGPDGLYRIRRDDATIERYLQAARRNDALLILNIQPGRASLLDEVRSYEQWLREPDVGIALDPEWAVDPDEIPGAVFGSTTGQELDEVAAYLAALVAAGDLPEKIMVYHQLHASIVVHEAALGPHEGVVIIKTVDGIGSAAEKVATWQRLVTGLPPHIHTGFKIFYEEDARSGPLMDPAQVLGLQPQPDYVLYE